MKKNVNKSAQILGKMLVALCAIILPIIMLLTFSCGECVMVIMGVLFVWSLLSFCFGKDESEGANA